MKSFDDPVAHGLIDRRAVLTTAAAEGRVW
jgi:hypothetical protein